SSCRVSELDYIFQLPLLNETIDESAMKDIAGAGCVNDRDFESERSHQSSMIEENSTVGAASNPDDWTTITGGKLLWVFGKVGTGNEIVNQPKQLMCRIIVNLIDIDKDRDSRFACPTRRLESSCRVAAVQMKHFCARDQLAVHLPNWVLKCRIAPPQNCSFAD